MSGDQRTDWTRREIERLRGLWPAEFKDGLSLGLGNTPTGVREAGDYPKGFHGWPIERRNAWYAGFNFGFSGRFRDDE